MRTLPIILLLTLLIQSCAQQSGPQNNPNAPVPATTYMVAEGGGIKSESYPGTIAATMQVDIRSDVEGYIKKLYFKEGSHVRKGQLLYELDSKKYQAAAEQAKAALKVAESNLELALKDAKRYDYLNEHDAIAKQTLDQSKTALENARNQVDVAKQNLVRAQTDLSYNIIKAPFDGVIGISQVREGAYILPGQTILNTISTDDSVAVDIVINEKQIARFQQLKNQPNDSTFILQLPEGSTYPYPGKISVIDRGVNPQTGSITVRLLYPNPESAIRPGMSCKIVVNTPTSATDLLIPNKAIVEQMGEYFVFVVKDSTVTTEDKKTAKPVEQRRVTTGAVIADNIVISSGLTPGETIVTEGVQKLHDGSLVLQSKK